MYKLIEGVALYMYVCTGTGKKRSGRCWWKKKKSGVWSLSRPSLRRKEKIKAKLEFLLLCWASFDKSHCLVDTPFYCFFNGFVEYKW
jgi:hypothetical protein